MTAILGAYWGKEMLLAEQQGRICDVRVNPDPPVHTAWDIGARAICCVICSRASFNTACPSRRAFRPTEASKAAARYVRFTSIPAVRLRATNLSFGSKRAAADGVLTLAYAGRASLSCSRRAGRASMTTNAWAYGPSSVIVR